MLNRQKESATGGAWRFRSYQEQQGFGGNPLRRNGNCSINPKNAAQLDEFRGDGSPPVFYKNSPLFDGGTAAPRRSPRSSRLTVARLTPAARATTSWVAFGFKRR